MNHLFKKSLLALCAAVVLSIAQPAEAGFTSFLSAAYAKLPTVSFKQKVGMAIGFVGLAAAWACYKIYRKDQKIGDEITSDHLNLTGYGSPQNITPPLNPDVQQVGNPTSTSSTGPSSDASLSEAQDQRTDASVGLVSATSNASQGNEQLGNASSAVIGNQGLGDQNDDQQQPVIIQSQNITPSLNPDVQQIGNPTSTSSTGPSSDVLLFDAQDQKIDPSVGLVSVITNASQSNEQLGNASSAVIVEQEFGDQSDDQKQPNEKDEELELEVGELEKSTEEVVIPREEKQRNEEVIIPRQNSSQAAPVQNNNTLESGPELVNKNKKEEDLPVVSNQNSQKSAAVKTEVNFDLWEKALDEMYKVLRKPTSMNISPAKWIKAGAGRYNEIIDKGDKLAYKEAAAQNSIPIVELVWYLVASDLCGELSQAINVVVPQLKLLPQEDIERRFINGLTVVVKINKNDDLDKLFYEIWRYSSSAAQQGVEVTREACSFENVANLPFGYNQMQVFKEPGKLKLKLSNAPSPLSQVAMEANKIGGQAFTAAASGAQTTAHVVGVGSGLITLGYNLFLDKRIRNFFGKEQSIQRVTSSNDPEIDVTDID